MSAARQAIDSHATPPLRLALQVLACAASDHIGFPLLPAVLHGRMYPTTSLVLPQFYHDLVKNVGIMAQQPARGNNQPHYPGIEVVPAERSPQASPQYYDVGAYPLSINIEPDGSTTNVSSAPHLQSYSDLSTRQSAFGPPPTHNVPPDQSAYHATSYPSDKAPAWQGTESGAPASEKPRRRRKKLWLWIVVAAVVIIAAVVGGVAGSLLTKHSDDNKHSGGGTSSG